MKISAILAALEAQDATKALAATLREEVGDKGDADVGDVLKRLDRAESNNKELLAAVAKHEADKAEALVAAAFAAAAKEHGIRADAIAAAQKLADLSGVQVKDGKVTGLTKELFDALKKAYPFLEEPKAAPTPPPAATPNTPPAAPPPPANTPPLPAGGTGGHTPSKITRADLAAGKVKTDAILKGEVELVD